MHTYRQFTTHHHMMLTRLLLAALVCLLGSFPAGAAEPSARLKAEAHPAPAILSIIPAQTEPGSNVTIFGSGFDDTIRVYLGSVEIPATVIDAKQLVFTVPPLDAGLYALYLKRNDGITGRVYNFTVLRLKPVLNELSPDRINSCVQGKGREISAIGKHFTESSLLMFDGAVIRSRVLSPETMTFSAPQVAGGLHQIMIKNDPENASVIVALAIETKPDIDRISVGNEYVNYYELLIDGRNFQQNSAIFVDGHRIGGPGAQESGERDKLVFVDCTRLIYQRTPYSPVTKDFRIQVINPDNEASGIVNVSAP